MPQDISLADIRQTFEDWSMYEAVIEHNYMRHIELADGLKAVAAELAAPLRIVDLGCGDAWLATHAFRDAQVESYRAVDLSESANVRAGATQQSGGLRADLCRGNLAEFVAALPDRSANLVLASNSLHHFRSEDKITIVRHIFRSLVPSGVFCWIDPVRNEDESRDEYLGRLTKTMQHDWVELSPDQRQRAVKHVWESDYPETAGGMCRLTAEAGFDFGGRFLQDALFGAWKFLKP